MAAEVHLGPEGGRCGAGPEHAEDGLAVDGHKAR